MPIRIEISQRLRFPARIVAFDEVGNERTALALQVLARRVPLEAVRADTEKTITQFLREVVEDWAGVQDESGAELPFSQEALAELLAVDGVPGALFQAYLAHAAPRLKN